MPSTVALFGKRQLKLAIEKVQRRASRIALGQKLREMSYEEQCILLNWNTLQHRREYLSVVECYKTVFGLNGLDFDVYFEFCRGKNTRANHPYKIQTKLTKVNSFKYSFFVRIVKDWYSLPNHLFTEEISVNKFKKGLIKKMDEDLLTQKLRLNCIYFILCFIFNIPFCTCTDNFYARFL